MFKTHIATDIFKFLQFDNLFNQLHCSLQRLILCIFGQKFKNMKKVLNNDLFYYELGRVKNKTKPRTNGNKVTIKQSNNQTLISGNKDTLVQPL